MASSTGSTNATNAKDNHAIEWDEQGQPISTHFDDVYFSKHNGLAETQYVFLTQNTLHERFAQLQQEHFVIAETGFGTGLNFLATWQLWQRTATDDSHLHFISVEKYPLDRHNLQRALALWPELETLSTALIAQYPDHIEGIHRLVFPDNLTLTLIIGDAAEGLQQLLGCHYRSLGAPQWSGVDAWFLDGFAPAKNPDMWSPTLFTTIAALSKPQATVATFTAAGVVKNGLRNAGFSIKKVAGYGRKRDMITACYTATDSMTQSIEGAESKKNTEPLTTKYNNAPWMIINDFQASSYHRPIAVIGGGIAGCHTAYALAQKGYRVTVFEKEAKLAQGASGNTQGVVYAKLSPIPEPPGEFNLFSLLYAQQFYRAFWQAHPNAGEQCGVLQLSLTEALQQQHQAIIERLAHCPDTIRYLGTEQASTQANTSVTTGGLFFPKAGWINPSVLCDWLCQHPNIDVVHDTTIHTINRINDQWQLEHHKGSTAFHTVVIANAVDAKQLLDPAVASVTVPTAIPKTVPTTLMPNEALPTKAIRGQVTHYPSHLTNSDLSTVVCGKGYIAPAHNGLHCLGASFNLGSDNQETTVKDHRDNLHQIQQQTPSMIEVNNNQTQQLEGRVGFRCTTPDYLPIVGAIPVYDHMRTRFGALKYDAKQLIEQPGIYHPNLYLNIGYGSRGLAYSPLCSEWLASLISGCPPPLPMAITHRLNPARFLIRDLIRSNNGKK